MIAIQIITLGSHDYHKKMNRRTSLKSLGVIAAGIALLPGCSDGLTLEVMEGESLGLSAPQATWINALSQAILPYGDHAIETLESFPDFITNMITQTYSDKGQSDFVSGYNAVTTSLKTKINSSTEKILPKEMIEYFKSTAAATEEATMTEEQKLQLVVSKEFIKNLRGLSIHHLTSSQSYMQEVDNYNIIPGQYQGAVTI